MEPMDRPKSTAAASGRLPWFLCAVLVTSILAGCTTTGVRVTGQNRESPTWLGTQSEAAVASAFHNGKVIVVAFNDLTEPEPYIDHTPTDRKVCAGASLMGWSFSTDEGKSWSYGGRVTPNADWPIIWGDPGITVSEGGYRYVFISNLAVPKEKYPQDCVLGSFGSVTGSPIGGACIARSSDGGKTFGLYQCITSEHDFYDGGSMASSGQGEIYTAYVNWTRNRIDIWRAANENSPFAMLPNPYPGMIMASHPRIRVDKFLGDLYVLAADQHGVLHINRYREGTWLKPTPASFPGVGHTTVQFADRIMRTGPQFSFDVGSPDDPEGRDAIRILYVRQNREKRHFIQSFACPNSLSPQCFDVAGWGSSSAADRFMPNVKSSPGTWKATFYARDGDPNGNSVEVRQGTLAVLPNGTRIFVSFQLFAPQTICPDTRGYWGDYNDLGHVGFSGTTPRFFYALSDSTAGCAFRWLFNSEHLHIRGTIFE